MHREMPRVSKRAERRQSVASVIVGERTYEFGVNSSSHASTPMHVSKVETTASPKGTVV